MVLCFFVLEYVIYFVCLVNFVVGVCYVVYWGVGFGSCEDMVMSYEVCDLVFVLVVVLDFDGIFFDEFLFD